MVAMSSGKDSDVASIPMKESDSKAESVPPSSSVPPKSTNNTVLPSSSPVTATFSDTPTSLSSSQPISSPTSTPSSTSTSSTSSTSTAPSTTAPAAQAQGAPATKDAPQTKKNSKLPTKCPLEKCLLCTREQPLCLMRSSTWPAIMRVVFYTLKYNNPEKEFFNLKDDVYGVMLFHWNKLAIHKKSASNWKKHIQDMLSHSKDIFESGLEIYGQNGYWRLKVNTDPWTLSGKTRRSPKKALNAKRPLEDTPMAEQMPRRPFIPYIAKAEPGKYAENYQQPVSYVFINEHTSPPLGGNAAAAVMSPAVRKESEPVMTPIPTSAPPSPYTPNPFSQRYTFVPVPFPGQATPPFPGSPQLQLQNPLSPSLQSFLSHPRLAVSLPSSRLPSPQRSRSPSPVGYTQSLPTSPRGINHPSYPSYSPLSAPASPSNSSPRASPYPLPKRKSVTQPPSPRSRPMSPRSRPMSPRSQPISPYGSPPASPHYRDRVLRGLRSPPSPQSPMTPLSPHSPVQEDSALDNLRSTFEQFHWHTQPMQAAAAQAAAQSQGAQPMQTDDEPHRLAFNFFATAKPANPCDVSFLLNE